MDKRFKETTDIYAVKQVSKVLFDAVPIKADDLMIVSHPFTSTCIQAISDPVDGFKMVNLTNDDEFEKWRTSVFRILDDCDNVYSIMAMVNKPYLMIWFKLNADSFSKEDYADCLTWCYTSQEFPNQDVNVSKEEISKLFKNVGVDALLDDDDRKYWESLPDTITIYRGVNRGSVNGLSWTTDRAKAKWFATRFNSSSDTARVFSAQVSKEDVLMYTNCRNEHEIVVDYRKLKGVTEITKSLFR